MVILAYHGYNITQSEYSKILKLCEYLNVKKLFVTDSGVPEVDSGCIVQISNDNFEFGGYLKLLSRINVDNGKIIMLNSTVFDNHFYLLWRRIFKSDLRALNQGEIYVDNLRQKGLIASWYFCAHVSEKVQLANLIRSSLLAEVDGLALNDIRSFLTNNKWYKGWYMTLSVSSDTYRRKVKAISIEYNLSREIYKNFKVQANHFAGVANICDRLIAFNKKLKHAFT